MAAPTGRRHTMRGPCVYETEARIRQLLPTASTVLARPQNGEEPDPYNFPAEADPIISCWLVPIRAALVGGCVPESCPCPPECV